MTDKLPEHFSIEELIDKCDALLEIPSLKLDQAAAEQSSIFFKIQRMIASESKALEFYGNKLASVELHLRRYYSGKHPTEVYKNKPLKYPPENIKEIDLCVKCDELFVNINKEYQEAKSRVAFLESVLWRIKERGNEIRSVIEWRKYIEAGI